MTKLSVASARAAAPKEARYEITDHEAVGLRLTVSATGNKSWLWRGRVGDLKVALTLGKYGDLSLDEARQFAQAARNLARQGIDPRKRKRRDAGLAERTVADVTPDYLEAFTRRTAPTSRGRGTVSVKTLDAEVAAIRRVVALIGDVAISKIDRDSVATIKSAPAGSATAVQTFGTARRIIEYAVEKGFTETNPFRSVRAPQPPARRSRYLSRDEFRAVVKGTHELTPIVGALHRFLLYVPLRKVSAANLKWAQVDGDLIRLDKTKGTGAWTVAMPRQAVELLTTLPRSGDLVFPSIGSRGKNIGGQFSGWSKAKRALDLASGVTDWRLHDARRTIVTLTADDHETFDMSAAEIWLQHVPPGIIATYQVSAMIPAMRKLAGMWAETIGQITD